MIAFSLFFRWQFIFQLNLRGEKNDPQHPKTPFLKARMGFFVPGIVFSGTVAKACSGEEPCGIGLFPEHQLGVCRDGAGKHQKKGWSSLHTRTLLVPGCWSISAQTTVSMNAVDL